VRKVIERELIKVELAIARNKWYLEKQDELADDDFHCTVMLKSKDEVPKANTFEDIIEDKTIRVMGMLENNIKTVIQRCFILHGMSCNICKQR